MGIISFSADDDSIAVKKQKQFPAAKITRVFEATVSIQKDEENLRKFEKVKEEYYNAFWKMKSYESSLSDQNQNSPFYLAQQGAMRPSEIQKILKQLKANLTSIEEEIRQINPEKLIQEQKQTIASQKIILSAQYARFFLLGPDKEKNAIDNNRGKTTVNSFVMK